MARLAICWVLPNCAPHMQVVTERQGAEQELRELRALMAAERVEHAAARGEAARLEGVAEASAREAAEAAEAHAARREAESRLASCELSLARLSGVEAEAGQLRRAAEAAEAAAASSRERERELKRQVSEAEEKARRELLGQAAAFQQRLGLL